MKGVNVTKLMSEVAVSSYNIDRYNNIKDYLRNNPQKGCDLSVKAKIDMLEKSMKQYVESTKDLETVLREVEDLLGDMNF